MIYQQFICDLLIDQPCSRKWIDVEPEPPVEPVSSSNCSYTLSTVPKVRQLILD